MVEVASAAQPTAMPRCDRAEYPLPPPARHSRRPSSRAASSSSCSLGPCLGPWRASKEATMGSSLPCHLWGPMQLHPRSALAPPHQRWVAARCFEAPRPPRVSCVCRPCRHGGGGRRTCSKACRACRPCSRPRASSSTSHELKDSESSASACRFPLALVLMRVWLRPAAACCEPRCRFGKACFVTMACRPLTRLDRCFALQPPLPPPRSARC